MEAYLHLHPLSAIGEKFLCKTSDCWGWPSVIRILKDADFTVFHAIYEQEKLLPFFFKIKKPTLSLLCVLVLLVVKNEDGSVHVMLECLESDVNV